MKENAKEQGQRKATHREPERSWSTVRKTAMIKKLGKKFFNILFRLFKKLLSDRNKTLDELQQTQSNLQKNIPKIVKKPNTPRAAVVGAPPLYLLIPINMSLIALCQAFSLLEDLIDECIHDVLFDVHRDIKQENSTCQICQTK